MTATNKERDNNIKELKSLSVEEGMEKVMANPSEYNYKLAAIAVLSKSANRLGKSVLLSNNTEQLELLGELAEMLNVLRDYLFYLEDTSYNV